MTLPSTDRGAAANVAGPGKRHPVEFTADAGEYFRIWIVNLALTIVTLGIYSAWAKVRKRRYFYGHTRIDGESFEYRANPVAILKGRLIAVAAIAVFYGAGYFAPLYQWLLWIPLLIGGPWLLVRSLAFNAYNTAYRNVRFRFEGTYKACLKVILVYGWLVLFGILYPYFKHRLIRFVAENHRYGTTRFEIADFKKPFIGAYANAFGLGIVLAVVVFGLGIVMVQGKAPYLFFGMAVLFYAGLFLLFAYIRARTTNAIWNAVRIGPLSFESALRARDLIWLYFSNLLAIAFTLGLATPWAAVRAMRYRASKTTAIASGPLDGFAQAEAQQVSVAGEEVAELFDIDIAL
jgi:uncharacterized membrane protein YjgN (DUF898 family)